MSFVVKYVQEACGTAYLAILKAIDEYLLNKGLNKKELPDLLTLIGRCCKNIWGFITVNC
ncbi:anthranilate/para-aminobenzoate synthases component I [Candidatus Brocadia sinica JPN1]|uniref:Anthranilate/para-aminobenzoate synthases component I n=1 Tax=Candidatus Brocadia sinica JPN1 TaxID=1197129 RepID=A0ABQ0JU81_9BACT|nr:DUF5618 family protein [Planctomycetota bacterium]NUO05653.1 DUF5618 family protein [Candidatus Brocadia sinica]GAN32314.1 anthranilate/para-aminobenzoate synthases component I [Candidatus Brocadia sinica JPN1]GIK14136.1 MAG: hypothetical protein BroJett002_28430 [Candidatus Brocadia sinica]GJQ17939.1 MAG: hypothetical protein HBSIN01_18980 [Candidatus Brocadia sinica]